MNSILHCVPIILQAAIKSVMQPEYLAYVTLVRCIYTIRSLYAMHIGNKDTKQKTHSQIDYSSIMDTNFILL
jgi:hypothetical protein